MTHPVCCGYRCAMSVWTEIQDAVWVTGTTIVQVGDSVWESVGGTPGVGMKGVALRTFDVTARDMWHITAEAVNVGWHMD